MTEPDIGSYDSKERPSSAGDTKELEAAVELFRLLERSSPVIENPRGWRSILKDMEVEVRTFAFNIIRLPVDVIALVRGMLGAGRRQVLSDEPRDVLLGEKVREAQGDADRRLEEKHSLLDRGVREDEIVVSPSLDELADKLAPFGLGIATYVENGRISVSVGPIADVELLAQIGIEALRKWEVGDAEDRQADSVDSEAERDLAEDA